MEVSIQERERKVLQGVGPLGQGMQSIHIPSLRLASQGWLAIHNMGPGASTLWAGGPHPAVPPGVRPQTEVKVRTGKTGDFLGDSS